MEYRQLGSSGMMVPALSYGTGSFYRPEKPGLAGRVEDPARMVDLCLDAGVSMFDTGSTYGSGEAESLLGMAIKGRRDQVIISTKAGMPTGTGPNDLGLSRYHLTSTIERSLRQLGTDYIDIFQLHTFDAKTPVEETLATLDRFVRDGKIRYLGVSNFAGWQLMKSLAAADVGRYPRYVVQQVYYSLVGRDFEDELMPLGLDQGVGAAIWSPLGWGRLTGKFGRGVGIPAGTKLDKLADKGPPVNDENLFAVLDVLNELSLETGRRVPQIALNWLLQRPTVSTIIVGAKNETQLRENLGAVGWKLTTEQVAKLDAASFKYPAYPRWHQQMYMSDRIPLPV
jgi:aryl-alcohol dehydrogenase-like predicted oxidoreductase